MFSFLMDQLSVLKLVLMCNDKIQFMNEGGLTVNQ